MAPTGTRLVVRTLLVACLLGALPACVYRVDVQQGNLLEQKDIETIQPGMTRNQVRFILGTPVASDAFSNDRWDYMYYLRPGRSRTATQRWVIVWFDGDVVREIVPDVPIGGQG